MNTLRLIPGQQQHISLHEQIQRELARLHEANKKYCLELIMDLAAEERLLFLNAYLVAVAALPNEAAAAAA